MDNIKFPFGDMDVPPEEHLIPTEDPDLEVTPVGTGRESDIPIYVVDSVLTDVAEYTASDENRELYGILVGGHYQYKKNQYVLVDGFLPLRHVVDDGAQLLTHEAWKKIEQMMEKRFPYRSIVGWHHTHPGYGVYLSRYDMFIHKSLFSHPYDIAIVTDPEVGMKIYNWYSGRIVQTWRYFQVRRKNSRIQPEAVTKLTELEQLRHTLEPALSETAVENKLPNTQCAAVAAIVQDRFGSGLVSATVQGQTHWFNRLNVGGSTIDADLTGDQFGRQAVQFGLPGSLWMGSQLRALSELPEEVIRQAALLAEKAGLKDTKDRLVNLLNKTVSSVS